MLVLTRKSGQAVVLNQTIQVTVEVKGDRVKVAVDAPSHVRVLREELATKPDEHAAGSTPGTFPK